jgi:hypothetical protein
MTTQTFDQINFLGLSVKSLSVNGIQSSTSLGSFNFVLVREPGQSFQFDNINPASGLGSGLIFNIGSLVLHGNIESWTESKIDARGTGIIDVRLQEAAADTVDKSFQEDTVLSFEQILSLHSNEIISTSEGWELDEINPYFLQSAISASSSGLDIVLTPEGGVNNIFKLEVANLPKTNIARFISPTIFTIIRSLGVRMDLFFDRVAFSQLDSGAQAALTIEVVNGFKVASLIRRDRYPIRSTKGAVGKVLSQLNLQFSNQGIKTTYIFNEYISQLDSKIKNNSEALVRMVKHENWRITPRAGIHNGFWSGFDPPIDKPTVDPNYYRPQDLELDDIIEALGQLGHIGWSIDLEQLEGGLGVIVDKAGSGPFYRVRRLNNIDIDPETFQRFAPDTFLSSEWERVRNLAEPVDSPGYLLPGTQVTIQIYKIEDLSTGIPFMEQSPQTFSPPIPET